MYTTQETLKTTRSPLSLRFVLLHCIILPPRCVIYNLWLYSSIHSHAVMEQYIKTPQCILVRLRKGNYEKVLVKHDLS